MWPFTKKRYPNLTLKVKFLKKEVIAYGYTRKEYLYVQVLEGEHTGKILKKLVLNVSDYGYGSSPMIYPSEFIIDTNAGWGLV